MEDYAPKLARLNDLALKTLEGGQAFWEVPIVGEHRQTALELTPDACESTRCSLGLHRCT